MLIMALDVCGGREARVSDETKAGRIRIYITALCSNTMRKVIRSSWLSCAHL